MQRHFAVFIKENSKSSKLRKFVIQYALALSSILYVLFPNFYHSNLLWDISPFLILIPSVIVSSLYGGFGPGICATIVGIVIGNYFFTHPYGTFFIDNAIDFIRVLLFGISGILISILSQLLHNAIARAQKEARDARISEERFRLLIEGATDYAIFLLDQHGRILTWNNPAEQLYEYKAHEVIHKNYSLFFTNSEQKKDVPFQALQTAVSEHKYDQQKLQIKKNGKQFWAGLYITPTKTATEFVVIVRDLTEEKELENQKRTFLSVVAHELKTPIAILRVIAQVLVDDYKKVIDKEILQDLNSELERTTILVEDLLDVSRLERGKLIIEKQSMNLTEAVNQVVERMRLIATKHTIVWNASDTILIHGDETRLKQVVINFISNAIKHSPKGTPITVAMQRENTGITLSVTDEGIGIEKEEQKHIFDIFYQVEKLYPKGFGLGLYISKEIIDQHGGRIWVESEKRKGSTFSFFLPFR